MKNNKNCYKISPKAKQIVSNLILISGSGRSGTTILGKLIHTAEEVEYAYESPTALSLFILINEINEDDWKLLFETFCYEELMLGYLAGRNLNFNRTDDSYIYLTKPVKAIQARLRTVARKKQLEQKVGSRVLCIKTPAIPFSLPKFHTHYPKARIVIINRQANDVINSIIQKRWFDDIGENSPNLIWPYRIYKKCKIPYWVKIKDNTFWLKATNIERAAYYYVRITESQGDISNVIRVNYHKLIEQPEETIRKLFKKLNLTYTDKTNELVTTIAQRKKKRLNLINQVPQRLKKKIKKLEAKYLN